MRSLRILPLAILVAFAAAACGGAAPRRVQSGAAPDDSIAIGSFDFSESRVLADLYAVALEAHGYEVTRAFDIGSRELVIPALEQDKVDFVPEYLGAALTFVSLGRAEVTSASRDMHEELSEILATRGIEALAYGPAQDQNGFVVTQDTAMRYNLIRISDLKPFADELEFGGSPECPERPSCLIGLEEVYGLHFDSFESLDVGGPATVAALKGAEVDVGLLFTTDPDIVENDFVLLKDDRRLQPAENVVPIVRREVIRRNPGIRALVDRVTRALSTDELAELNRLVEIEQQDTDAVAHEWLILEGLIR